MIGGGAKHAYLCRGRTFTGELDDCFNDYLPIAEIAAAALTLLTAYLFYRYSRALFGVSSARGEENRYSFDDPPNGAHLAAVAGVVWAAWRASTYPLAMELLPFIGFWVTFAIWFGFGVAFGWLPPITLDATND